MFEINFIFYLHGEKCCGKKIAMSDCKSETDLN